MPILNQLISSQSLGDVIIDKLSKIKKNGRFVFFSAFAKTSGVQRLEKSMKRFKKNGGFLQGFIGVDLDGTSYEALLDLFNLCDELYIVHAEDPCVTYHSKVYFIESETERWFAIGSNNMTGGGLWTNFESCYMSSFSPSEKNKDLDDITAFINTFTNPLYPCSKKLSSVNDIEELLNENYIAEEARQSIARIKAEKGGTKKTKKMFGTQKYHIPKLVPHTTKSEPAKKKTTMVQNVQRIKTKFKNECFWFEMGVSTGGSRNILDLSKQGRIQKGNVDGTQYSIAGKTNVMQGGVKFFGLDPNDVSKEKNIKIKFNGMDFCYSTIKFTQNNGSWRIQLKGKAQSDSDLPTLSRYGSEHAFQYKILFFEKITTDYYALSLMDEKELDMVKEKSEFWALNGSRKDARAFGKI